MRLVPAAAALLVACSSGGAREPRAAPPWPDAGASAAIDGAPAAAPGADVASLPVGAWDHDELVADNHVCARRDDGRVLCWGQNNFGEVGDARGVEHPVPILV